MQVVRKNENDALITMLVGVETLLETVGQSLGPFGKATVMISPERDVLYTSHGIDIVETFQLADALEMVGVRFLRHAAEEVNRFAGDATTTATVIVGSLFVETVKLITSGHNSQSIQSGVNQALVAAVRAVRAISRPIQSETDLRAVARSASRGDMRDVEAVLQAWRAAADHGYISTKVEDPSTIDQDLQTSVVLSEDIRVPGSLLGFTEGAPIDCAFDVVVLEESAVRTVTPSDLLSGLPKQKKPILLLLTSLPTTRKEDDAKQNLNALLAGAESRGIPLLVNVDQHSYNASIITLQDVAAFAGTRTVHGKPQGPLPVGSVDNVRQTDGRLSLTGGRPASREFKTHVENLLRIIKEHKGYEPDTARKRLALLLGRYVTVTAFDVSEENRKERATILKNMTHAVIGAQQTGIVPGGGCVFSNAADAIAEVRPTNEIERFGFEAVRRALTRPVYWIVKNAGKEPTSLIEEMRKLEAGVGFDAKTGQVCDLIERGVVDPAMNALAILQTALSTIRAMLNVSSLIHIDDEAELNDDDDRMSPLQKMGGGGRRRRRI